jgi:hypothetical protein
MVPKLFFSLLIALGASLTSFSQVVTTADDISKAELIMGKMVENQSRSSSDLMAIGGLLMLDTPYVAGTLDNGDKEQLTIYTTKTDCILMVETVFNMVQSVRQAGAGADFKRFSENVRMSRYRDGIVEHYSDRIHYTTEWIRQKEARGLVKDLTMDIGGITYYHPISYMSRHISQYPQLASAATDPEAALNLSVIKAVENVLNYESLCYIPKADIYSIEPMIKSGDIICIISDTPGLDIAHVGMAFWRSDGKLGFLHASMKEGKVVIDEETLAQYPKIGIKVIRVL